MPGRQQIKFAFQERFGHEKDTAFLILRTDLDSLWEPFSARSKKKASENQCKNRYRKSDRKCCHWSQTGFQNDTKIEPEIIFFQFLREKLTLGNCQSSSGKTQHFED